MLIDWLSLAWIDNEDLRHLSGHHLDVKELSSYLLVRAVVNIKHVVVFAEDSLEVRSEVAHKHLCPKNKDNGLGGILSMLVLLLKVAHVSIEHAAHKVTSLETRINDCIGELLRVQSFVVH